MGRAGRHAHWFQALLLQVTDRLPSHHISLVKAHNKAAASFMGSEGKPGLFGGPHELDHTVPTSLGGMQGQRGEVGNGRK